MEVNSHLFIQTHRRESTLILDIPPLAHYYYIFKCTTLSVHFGNNVYFFYTQILLYKKIKKYIKKKKTWEAVTRICSHHFKPALKQIQRTMGKYSDQQGMCVCVDVCVDVSVMVCEMRWIYIPIHTLPGFPKSASKYVCSVTCYISSTKAIMSTELTLENTEIIITTKCHTQNQRKCNYVIIYIFLQPSTMV